MPSSSEPHTYTWKAGDTMALVAHVYCRPKQWQELVDLNKGLLYKVKYRLQAGDVIQIPDSWFPIPNLTFRTKFIGSKGERIL